MNRKTAFLFPGQGSQYVGMGRDFFDSFSQAKEIFQEADDRLGENLSSIIFAGPEERLTQTRNAQVAIFVTSVAILKVIECQFPDLTPMVCAGLSLGEYTALYASGRLPFAETLLLVRERARLMNEACEKNAGTMAAVLGLDALAIESAVQGIPGVWVANFNAPGQTVVSGTREGIDRATAVLKEKGAKRVIPLTVHGAFHSGLMEPARLGLSSWVQRAPLKDSPIALCMNVPGQFVESADKIKEYLTAQVTGSVRWEQGIQAMDRSGVGLYLEIGCGKTLAALNRKIGVNGQTLSVERVEDLETLAQQIEKPCSC